MGADADLRTRIAELELSLAAEVELRQRLVEILARLGSGSDLDALLRATVTAVADVLHAESGSLLLVDGDSGDLTVAVATGASEPDIARVRVPAGRGFAGWVAEHREPVLVADPQSDDRFYEDVDAASDFETTDVLAVPLLKGDRAVGVLELVNKLDGSFDEEDLDTAAAFASLAVIALSRDAGPPGRGGPAGRS